MSSYEPPYRRQNESRLQKPRQSSPQTSIGSVKLAENEVLLPDGRILIRGTLRKDGTRRPDRYKRAGFRNDEDVHRNKYIPRQAQIRQQQSRNLNNRIQQQNTIRHSAIRDVQSLVLNIIHDPPKSIHTNNSDANNLNIDFKQNVLKPLLNEFYEENEALLLQEITQYFTKNMNKCKALIEKNQMRSEIIKFIHRLLFDKKNKRHLLCTNNKTKQRVKQTSNNTNSERSKMDSFEPSIRGKGNFSYGTGVMLSDNIEKERRKEYEKGNRLKLQMRQTKKKNKQMDKAINDKTTSQDRKRRRVKVRKLNQKYKEIKKLEQRQMSGETLNDQQIAKIESKQDVLAKLTDLKISVSQPTDQ